ncbi:hypothetical protein LLH03_09565, partial [bacterium]|nr:hypothetical protein [bacterium]
MSVLSKNHRKKPVGDATDLTETIRAYYDYLRACGCRPEEAKARCTFLAPLVHHARAKGFKTACSHLKRITMEMRRGGQPEDDIEACLTEMKGFASWLSGEAPALTEKRVAYLKRLAAKPATPIPALVPWAAIEGLVTEGTPRAAVDASIILLVAVLGLSAQDLRALTVGSASFEHGLLTVPLAEPRVLPLPEVLAKALAPLVMGRSADEPLLTNDHGGALTPKRLRERFSARWSALAGVDPSVTLERLRDCAARLILSDGYGWDHVAGALGLADARSARRRFAGEAWEYCADREGQWFTLEAVGDAEHLTAEQLWRLIARGMRHVERDGRVYLRRPDLYACIDHFAPAETALPQECGPSASTWDGPLSEAVADFVEALGDLDDTPRLEAAYSAVQAAARKPTNEDAGALMHRLTSVGASGLHRLTKARRACASPEEALHRACIAAELDQTPQPPRAADPDVLREVFVDASPDLRVLEAAVQTAQAAEAGDLLGEQARGLLHTPYGVEVLLRVLANPEQAVWFWLLVDRHWPTFARAYDAVKPYYGLTDKAVRELLPGCALYAFFVAAMVSGGTTPSGGFYQHCAPPEELLIETMVQWLGTLLLATRALPLNTKGDPLFPDSLAEIHDEEEFQQAFVNRWDALAPYRRGRWSFWVLPYVGPADAVRFCSRPPTRQGKRPSAGAGGSEELLPVPGEAAGAGNAPGPRGILFPIGRALLCLLCPAARRLGRDASCHWRAVGAFRRRSRRPGPREGPGGSAKRLPPRGARLRLPAGFAGGRARYFLCELSAQAHGALP